MRWTIQPGPARSGAIRVPGDKSITHRAFLFGLLAEGETWVSGANPGEDCSASLRAASALGAEVREENGAIHISGTAGRPREPADVLDCGNSGTTLRLLAGALAGHPLLAVLTGDESLRRRPVDRVIEPLRRMGARLHARANDRLPPLVVEGGPLRGTAFDEPTPSAQVATCLLLAGLAAEGETGVRIAWGVRDHTLRMLPAFGVEPRVGFDAGGPTHVWLRGPSRLRPAAVSVPGDPSAAAFFMAAAAISPGASVRVENVSLNSTRMGFASVLERMGAGVEWEEQGESGGEPVGAVTVSGPPHLEADDVPRPVVPSMVDEVPAWAAVAALARGTSRLSGAGELRVKESDRLKAIAENLASLGIAVEEHPDGLAITGGSPRGGPVRAHGDHRIAMAFAILGSRAAGPVVVDDARSVRTSFPAFVETFRGLGMRIEEAGGEPA